MPLSAEIAAQELLQRRSVRGSFLAWCKTCGFEPARHHQLLIEELEAVVRGDVKNLMVLMPPGAAKSTYTSKLFPPWFLAQRPNLTILACSHSGELATSFGRIARNYAEGNERWLGYRLDKASRAADEWETSNQGRFFCNGVGAGLSGHRADLGLIDDFCGKEEDVNSKLFNDKVWDWYLNDFVPRLKPGGARVIIANHRSEDDLVGRLLAKESDKWRVLRFRLLIETGEQEEEDPLGRKKGEWLWPEYFTKELVEERMQNPRASGIEQQEPSPEKGGFFQKEWFDNNEYKSLEELKDGQVYAASDHAVSEKQTADNTCLGLGVFKNGYLYIHPDLVWDRIGTKRAVEEMLRMGSKYKPLYWWAEKGHISKSLLPFLQDRMMDERKFFNIIQVTPVKDKMTRAQSIQGMMSMGLVKWPSFAPWFQRARREMLMFPNGKHDDFVDFVAHLGRGIHQMVGKRAPEKEPVYEPSLGMNITPKTLKEQGKKDKRALLFADR
jgi:predicted phage terminase large subunit-like protein